MKSGYNVKQVDLDNAFRAYSLMRMVAPCFPVGQWAELVASADRWMLISVEDVAGYIRGLAAYRIEKHPVAGELMDVPIFVAASVIDDAAIAEAIFASLRKRATGCCFLRVWADVPKDFVEMENEQKFLRWDHGLMIKVDQNPPPALL